MTYNWDNPIVGQLKMNTVDRQWHINFWFKKNKFDMLISDPIWIFNAQRKCFDFLSQLVNVEKGSCTTRIMKLCIYACARVFVQVICPSEFDFFQFLAKRFRPSVAQWIRTLPTVKKLTPSEIPTRYREDSGSEESTDNPRIIETAPLTRTKPQPRRLLFRWKQHQTTWTIPSTITTQAIINVRDASVDSALATTKIRECRNCEFGKSEDRER